LNTDDGGDQIAKKDSGSDSGSMVMKYMAQIPDAGPDLPAATPAYMAPILLDANTALPDSGFALRYMAQQPADAAPDTSRVVALYMAPLPAPSS
jgi:hypothetical protein